MACSGRGWWVWTLVGVACSSANPAFDEAADGDTEATLATSGVSADAGDPTGDSSDPTATDGPPAVGTCSPDSDFLVKLEISTGNQEVVRRCGAPLEMVSCDFSLDGTDWIATNCVVGDPDGIPLGPYRVHFGHPPQLGQQAFFRGDLVVEYEAMEDGCGLAWGYVSSPASDVGQPATLVWAGSNKLETPLQFPLTANPAGPVQSCECGADTVPCDPDYGPQKLEICYEGFLACGEYVLMDNDAPVMVGDLLYGVVILHAWEPENDDVPGDYRYVARLLDAFG